jgi:hypothetical protein
MLTGGTPLQLFLDRPRSTVLVCSSIDEEGMAEKLTYLTDVPAMLFLSLQHMFS